jgi:predicted Zn-dependent peptidase
MNVYVKSLASGMKVAHKRISSPVAYCSLSIKAGTRNESRELNGMAHLTEHMLFKGTESRGARRINNYLERLGGELNAYTTKEETVIHATVLKEDIGKAVELLADIAFNSVFPEKELLKEKIIVMDEISSYKDTPSEQIYDDFEEYLFGTHPLSMPILGTPEKLCRFLLSAFQYGIHYGG